MKPNKFWDDVAPVLLVILALVIGAAVGYIVIYGFPVEH